MPDAVSLTMLPAKEGDCLHVAYGEAPDEKHILIDAGRQWTWKHALKAYIAERGIKRFELVVVTHVDRDHIDGMLAMLGDPGLDLEVGEFWFNSYEHLLGNAVLPPRSDDDMEHFGARMGEELSSHAIAKHWPWNSRFHGRAVETGDNGVNNLIQLDDVSLTLLSPDRAKLEALKPTWEKECKKAGLTPGATVEDYVLDEDDDIEAFGAIDIDQLAAEPFEEDSSRANGASIAFILEYKGVKLLLSGDAHADRLVKSLKALGASPDNPLPVGAFKVPHHGSKYNISQELLELLSCEHYLVSTNGNYFKHPENVAMARLIKYGTADSVLDFNYSTEFNKVWKNADWQTRYRYAANYPARDRDGYLTLSFPATPGN